MARWVCFLGIWGWLMGCAGEKTDHQIPSPGTLQAQFLDITQSEETRLLSAHALMAHHEGRAFLVAQYWTAHRLLIQKLVDQLILSNPEQAARLLAGLMAAARGEEKLHFESRLLPLGDSAVPALVDLIKSNPDWQTAMQALDALGKLKAAQGITVMGAQLLHANDWVRMSAAHALGEVGNDEAVAVLMTAVNDTSDTVVAAVLIALGKTGNQQAFLVCVKQLHHDNPRVRAAAVSALGRFEKAEAKDFLIQMLHDRDEGVRFKAHEALARLNSK